MLVPLGEAVQVANAVTVPGNSTVTVDVELPIAVINSSIQMSVGESINYPYTVAATVMGSLDQVSYHLPTTASAFISYDGTMGNSARSSTGVACQHFRIAMQNNDAASHTVSVWFIAA